MEQEQENNAASQLNDELNTSAEFQGNKDDEEDVLLTAQRYLNIHHQIHIFKEFRKKQFDEELMQVPHEIRKVIALLPGGRLLLEHIAELFEQNGKTDASLAALLKSLEGKSHFADSSVSAASEAAPVTVAAVAPTITAPIELGGDFTKALTDSFNAYSQNLHALTVNIQKMAVAQQSAAPAAVAPIELGEDFSKALTASFDTYAQNLHELTENIQKMAVAQQSAAPAAVAPIGLGEDFSKALTASFDTYAQNLHELTENIQKIAVAQQSAAPAAVAPIELGEDFSKALTASFDTYAQNLHELTENIQKIAVAQQSAAPATVAPIELGEDFSKALTASFDTYAQNLHELTENIQKIAVNSASSDSNKSTETLLPKFKDSIAEILQENAKQQMNVLKNFGETLSKSIIDSQKELIATLKNTTQNYIPTSMPTAPTYQSVLSEQSNNSQPAPVEKPKKSAEVKQTAIKDSSSVQPKEKSPNKENSAKQTKNNASNKEDSTTKTDKSKSANTQSSNLKNKSEQDLNNPAYKSEKNTTSKSTPLSATEAAIASNEMDINDVFAQLSGALSTDDDIDAKLAATAQKSNSSFVDDFENDITPHTSSEPVKSPNKPTPKTDTTTSDYNDEMSKIRSALNSTETISLEDFDNIAPVSLNPEDDTISRSFEEFTGQSYNDELSEAFNDDSGLASTPNDANNVTSDNDDSQWEYEYVDENGNPISVSDDAQWEYVDENGNPITPQDDDEWEYEYVDENGNPVS
ncbi:MAG: hypothetical protein IJ218_03840 [Alphaproteobacteria bacterium]|nr:hypothetical protein [Alphaproteobacteria bacterium]